MTALFIVMSLQCRVYRSRAGAQQLLAGARMAGEASLSTESGNRHWGVHSFIQDSQTLHLLSALRGQQDRPLCLPAIDGTASLHTFLSRIGEILSPFSLLQYLNDGKCRSACSSPYWLKGNLQSRLSTSPLFPHCEPPTQRLSLSSSWEGDDHHLTFVSYLELLSWM